MKMGQNIQEEITQFHKAISACDYEMAENIITSATFVSTETTLAWGWIVKNKRGFVDLNILYQDIVDNNFYDPAIHSKTQTGYDPPKPLRR